MANDENYRDPTNLENKLQKHQEFEAEVNANEQRIQNIAQVCLQLPYESIHCVTSYVCRCMYVVL